MELPTLNMLFILNLITFVNLLVLFLILFFRKQNTLPNKILALILIVPGINFLSNTVILAGHFIDFPYLFFASQITAFAFAPLVLIYSKLMIGQRINWKHPVYFVSFATMIMIAGFGVEYELMPEEEQLAYLKGLQQEPYPWQQNLINSIFIVLQQLYFTLSIITIYRYQKRVYNTLSNVDKTKIAYTRRFILFIWLLNLITILLYILLPMTTVEYIALPLVLTVIYFFIVYYAFQYHSIFTPESYTQFLADTIPASLEREMLHEEDLDIEERDIDILAKKINTYLEEKEAYLDANLSLDMLAKMMNVPAGKISTAINKGMKKNFFDLINQKRVEKSKSILKAKHTTDTIEAIAYEAGFNSRASFYRAFKKFEQLTPKEFLQNLPVDDKT